MCCLSTSDAGWYLSSDMQHAAFPFLPALNMLLETSIFLQAQLCTALPKPFHLDGQHLLLYQSQFAHRHSQRKLAHSFIAITCRCLEQKSIWCHIGMARMLGTYLMPWTCFGSAQHLACNAVSSNPNKVSSLTFSGAGNFTNIFC